MPTGLKGFAMIKERIRLQRLAEKELAGDWQQPHHGTITAPSTHTGHTLGVTQSLSTQRVAMQHG